MGDRPTGVTILALYFGVTGIGALLGVLQTVRFLGEMPSDIPLPVAAFFAILPVYLLVLGLLGWVGALALWAGHPFGRYAGYAIAGLWIVQDAFVLSWGMSGSEVVKAAGVGGAGAVLRILVSFGIILYLRSERDGYLKRIPERSPDW